MKPASQALPFIYFFLFISMAPFQFHSISLDHSLSLCFGYILIYQPCGWCAPNYDSWSKLESLSLVIKKKTVYSQSTRPRKLSNTLQETRKAEIPFQGKWFLIGEFFYCHVQMQVWSLGLEMTCNRTKGWSPSPTQKKFIKAELQKEEYKHGESLHLGSGVPW